MRRPDSIVRVDWADSVDACDDAAPGSNQVAAWRPPNSTAPQQPVSKTLAIHNDQTSSLPSCPSAPPKARGTTHPLQCVTEITGDAIGTATQSQLRGSRGHTLNDAPTHGRIQPTMDAFNPQRETMVRIGHPNRNSPLGIDWLGGTQPRSDKARRDGSAFQVAD